MIGVKIDLEKIKCGITVRPQSCVRMYYKDASCTSCTDFCPENAVKVGLPGTVVRIDPSVCSSCEICIGACPYGVFALSGQNDLTRTRLLLGKKSGNSITLSCLKDKKETASNLECLGSVNSVIMLFIFVSGIKSIHMNFKHCSGCCNIEPMLSVLTRELIITEKILSGFNTKLFKIIIHENKLSLELDSDIFKLKKTAMQTLTRRDFFSHVKKNMLTNLSVIAEILEQEPVNRVRIGEKNAVNNRKHMANQIIKRLSERDIETNYISGFPYANIYVNKTNCTGCRTCEKTCPTGAVIIDENSSFKHNSYKCTGCFICKDVCARGCISAL